MEDEAAIKAEAAQVVAAARKELEERTKAQAACKQAKTPEELQALINSRLKSSMAGRVSALTPPLVATEAEAPEEPWQPGKSVSASDKAEAAKVVATANRERDERIAAQKAVKTATPEEIQAMINARLSAR
ncbi:hypothetical protein M885DRAFT_530204 [Pelagophyceae sp. CCMP2097]|nr:hypothetical protein M885DRAFT_530204 [Pelagophyceae sp. CCMP2097]